MEKEEQAQVAESKPKRPSLRKGAKAVESKETAAKPTKVKAASKPEAVKAEPPKVAEKKAKPKAEPKTEAKAAAFVPRLAQKGKPIYALDEPSRPRSGRLLLAHTHAALSVLGLLSDARPAIPKSSLLTLLGARAVKYHIEQDNLESAPDNGIRLSLKGLNAFRQRHVDTAAATAFQSAFLDNKADPAINVAQRNLFQTNLG